MIDAFITGLLYILGGGIIIILTSILFFEFIFIPIKEDLEIIKLAEKHGWR